MAYDLLIQNAMIVDGTGAPGFLGDVAVRDGNIADVGKVSGSARRVINAQGATLTPGFIDIHTHMDAQLLWDPLASSSCWHGITSLVMGNCSFGVAPCKPRDRNTVLRTLERVEGMSLQALTAGVDWSWETFPQYLDRIDRSLGLNVAAFIGHSAVRQYVMGDAASERRSTPAEMAQMQETMRKGLKSGAYGMSFNFSASHIGGDGRPVPSRLAGAEEVLAMASLMREGKGGAIQIADNIQPGKEPLDFCEEVSRASGCSVWWIPLLQFYSQPGEWKSRLEYAAKMVAAGSRVRGMTTSRTIDALFTMKNAHIFDGLPAWKDVLVKAPDEVLAALRKPEVRAAFQEDFSNPKLRIAFSRRWDMVQVIDAKNQRLKKFNRRKISDLATEQQRSGLDVFLDLCVEDNLETEFLTVLANGDEAAAAEILRHPDTLVGLSDAGAHAALECGYGFSTHLLGYWVRKKQIMPIEEAVRKLTSMLADQIGFDNRGRIKVGLAADLNLINPETVDMLEPVLAWDFPAGAKRFIQKAEGIINTVVNGEVLMENGEHTGAYPGKLLRRVS